MRDKLAAYESIKIIPRRYWRVILVVFVLIVASAGYMIVRAMNEPKIPEATNDQVIEPVVNPENNIIAQPVEEKPAEAETAKPASTSTNSNKDTTQAPATETVSTDPAPVDNSSNDTPSSSNNSDNSAPTETTVEDVPPTLYLPFSASTLPDSMTPMGETIYHPKPQNPQGHPGIDYQWSNPSQTISILASMDGEVTAIEENTYHIETYDLSTRNGRYRTTYTEMEAVNPSLKVGDQVKVGDLIGNPQHPSTITDQPNFRMIHWEFGLHSESNPFWGDRLCPMTYFAASAKSTIETIWANLSWPELKANAPDICSGDYAE